MSAENNKILVRRYFEDAWNKHNPAVVDEIYAADFVDRSPDIPGIAHTREGLKQFMGMYLRAFPDATITVEDQLVEGDQGRDSLDRARNPDRRIHGHAAERQEGSRPGRPD